MKRSEIYLKAAEIIQDGRNRYACHAIEMVMHGSHWRGKPDLTEYDAPEFFLFEPVKPHSLSWFWDSEPQECNNERITVLLFASELAKDTNN